MRPIFFVLVFLAVACDDAGTSSSNNVNNTNNVNNINNTNNANNTNNVNNTNNNTLCDVETRELSGGYFVSPTGLETAAGTQTDPLNLAFALSSGSPALPGDTIYLTEGTYTGRFISEIEGTDSSPIVVMPMPGHHVIIDGVGGDQEYIILINGDYVHFVGLEVTDSDTLRESAETGSSPSDITRGAGFGVFGTGTKVVNCVVHDTAQGISFWTPAVDAQLHGNIIYNNGWNAPDRGHGHAIYTQNENGTKVLSQNVMFYGYSFGVHAYTEGGSIQGFHLLDNVWFLNGASVPDDGGIKDNCLIGGLQPVDDTVVERNMGWATSPTQRSVKFGYGESIDNASVIFSGNYQVGNLDFTGNWEHVEITDNTIYGVVNGVDMADYPENTVTTELPTGYNLFIRPNYYNTNQSMVVIYNWSGVDQIDVDLSQIITGRHQYSVHSVFDRFGTPVTRGVFDSQTPGGTVITIPMGTVAPPQPTGAEGNIVASEDPGTLFGVFIVTHNECVDN
ncbi:hypothetical protein KKF84_15150 [Myxococcota bacterium]|nr:hypothetical protein [Myxococcota bacterium]